MKDKERKLTRVSESPIVKRRSRILGIWSFLCPFTYCILCSQKFITTNAKFAGGGGGSPVVVFVVSRLRNVKSVSSPVI